MHSAAATPRLRWNFDDASGGGDFDTVLISLWCLVAVGMTSSLLGHASSWTSGDAFGTAVPSTERCPSRTNSGGGGSLCERSQLEANRARDADTVQRLNQAGWMAIIVWEHDDLDDAADRIEALVRSRSRC